MPIKKSEPYSSLRQSCDELRGGMDASQYKDYVNTFRAARLLDAYDVYEHLMGYWAETMQDDVYMIVSDGWKEAVKPRLLVEDKEKKTQEKADFTVGKLKFKAELVPPALMIARYFSPDKAAIESLVSIGAERCGCADRRAGPAHRQEARPQTGRHAAAAHRQATPPRFHRRVGGEAVGGGR